jgi:hypothetical protein
MESEDGPDEWGILSNELLSVFGDWLTVGRLTQTTVHTPLQIR